jgi:putative colanic acid biosynthesis acetyltransferase WcaF
VSSTDLSLFNNTWYKPGGRIKRMCWYFMNLAFFRSGFVLMPFKRFLLRAFGARIGKGVVIKPHVSIKYPWKLSVGNHAWIGEGVWIDNLGVVTIGDHCCISQGALLLCGNHDYTRPAFDLIVKDITLESGVWIGARSVVCPGVVCHEHSVLAVGSVATQDLEARWIYRGNPAEKVRERKIVA